MLSITIIGAIWLFACIVADERRSRRKRAKKLAKIVAARRANLR